jgi:hypothetical protein
MYYLVSYDSDRWKHMLGMRYYHNRLLIEAVIKYEIYYEYDNDELTLIGSVSEIAEFLLLVVMPFEFRLCCVID